MRKTIVSVPAAGSACGKHLSLAVAGATVLALVLVVRPDFSQPSRHGGPRTPAASVAAADAAGRPVRFLAREDATTGQPANREDTWEVFLHQIQQAAPQRGGSDLPAYELPLGLTSEPAAGGASVVKRLVLDLGDLSVHAVGLAIP